MTLVHQPGDAAGARDAVRDAIAAKRRLELIGGGGRRGYGRPVLADEVLDLSALNAVVSYQPEELVLTVGVGARLPDIESLLGERHQQLAFEPPDFAPLWGGQPNCATIGGTLMMGLGGPRRPFAGAPRDHLLGIRGINGFGEEFAAGGRVVKNVTGYDLPKLLAGSLGTLAVLTEVTVKVLPAPPVVQTLLVPGLDDGAAIALMASAMGGPAAVSAAAHLPAALAAGFASDEIRAIGSSVTLLRIEGVEPSVLARMRGLRERLGSPADTLCLAQAASQRCWQSIRDLAPFHSAIDRPLWRVSLPASRAAAFAAALARQVDMRHFYDWGGSLLWIELPASAAAEEQGAVRSHLAATCGTDGHATLMRASDALRLRIAPMQPLAPGLAELTRRVKARFDPDGVFNHGRMVGDW